MKRASVVQTGSTWMCDGVAVADFASHLTKMCASGLIVDLSVEEERLAHGKIVRTRVDDGPAFTRAFDEAKRGPSKILVVDVEQPPSSAAACAIVDVRARVVTAVTVATRDALLALNAQIRPAEVVILKEASQQLAKRLHETGAHPIVRSVPPCATHYDPDGNHRLREVPAELVRVVAGAFEFLDALRRMESFLFVANDVSSSARGLTINADLVDALSVGAGGEFVSPAKSAEGRDLYRRRACAQQTDGDLETLRTFWSRVSQDEAVAASRAFPSRELGLASSVATCMASKTVNCTNASVQSARDGVCNLLRALEALVTWTEASSTVGFPRVLIAADLQTAIMAFPEAVRAHAQ